MDIEWRMGFFKEDYKPETTGIGVRYGGMESHMCLDSGPRWRGGEISAGMIENEVALAY